eukprot:SAG25_NODE_1654_length_2608_cov_89.128556_4_plen_68_part_00
MPLSSPVLLEPEPEAEEPLPRHVEIRDGQHVTQDGDHGVVELDQDVESLRPASCARGRLDIDTTRYR